MHRHPNDWVRIMEEGRSPLPKCELCGMQMPFATLRSASHRTSQTCIEGQTLKEQRRREEIARRTAEQVFTACGTPLDSVTEFKYLGRLLSCQDKDWPAL